LARGAGELGDQFHEPEPFVKPWRTLK